MNALSTLRTLSKSFIAAIFLAGASVAQAQGTWHFNLPAQPLADALRSVGGQASTNVFFEPKLVAGRQAPSLLGTFTVDAALSHLLAGTGLGYRFVDSKTVAVEPMSSRKSADESKPEQRTYSSQPFSTSSLGALPPSPTVGEGRGEGRGEAKGRRVEELEEVVVTGTHMRGVSGTASQTAVYTRDEIDLSGLGSIQEFLQRLPQNFGAASEDTNGTATGGVGVFNSVGGTGVNLRGVGSDSTLILLNGRRLAAGNRTGNFVDVSMIPMNAVDRIEVVSDGASAIYGSDAVGGVVNIIMRTDFEGAETRARYGSVTRGDSHEIQVGQSAGLNWGGGSALVSYEYFDRTPLDSNDRPYARSAADPFTLLGPQKRHSAFGSVRQRVGQDIELFADGTYSQRESYFDISTSTFQQRTRAKIESFSALAGLDRALSERFAFELTSSYSESDTHEHGYFPTTTMLRSEFFPRTSIFSIDPKLEGALGQMPAGRVRFAVGGQYRSETFKFRNGFQPAANFSPDREVIAGFLEVRVPLLSADSDDASNAGSALELVLADRYEDYSDFGSTNNGKAGVLWRPISGLTVRGTYGTSFKAPLLNDVNPTPRGIQPMRVQDPAVGALQNAIFIFGGNPDLEPEDATTWSFGMDIQPHAVPGFEAHATYFDIHYKNRIQQPSVAISSADSFVQEAVLGPTIVQRNPSGTRVAELYASPTFSNPLGLAASSIVAVVDYRFRNLSLVDTQGFDLGLSYSIDTARQRVELGVDGTYILKFDTQFTATAPTTEILNTPYNPVDLRLRGRGVLKRGDFTLALFLNYTDSYTDSRVGSIGRIDSWTTADLTLAYETGPAWGLLSNLSAMFGLINLTDEAPPFVANSSLAVPYDGVNANALGRFAYIQVAKRWGRR